MGEADSSPSAYRVDLATAVSILAALCLDVPVLIRQREEEAVDLVSDRPGDDEPCRFAHCVAEHQHGL